jgi:hypothetical protein
VHFVSIAGEAADIAVKRNPYIAVIEWIVDLLGGIRATVFFVLLLLAIAGAKFWQHKAHSWEAKAGKANAALAVEQADKARILAQLADADHAAKVAIAAKVEAERAAAKRLKAREKEWRRIYGAKPENRAWAETPIPPDILGNLSK